jgi:Zn-dependent M16 (insulinase) family peptidase
MEAAEEGFDKNLFETQLHQIELNAKRTKEHRGLGYLSHMVPMLLHGGDPLAFFKIDEYSQRIR